MKRLALLFILAPILTFGQMSKQDSVWLPLNFMIGTWTGTSEGQPGNGKYERTYQFALNKKFIEAKTGALLAMTEVG